MPDESTVVLLVPTAPSDTGNGLAMRAGMLLDALAAATPVHTVIVPVSGPADDCSWAAQRARSVTVMAPVADDAGRVHSTALLADPELRDRLQRTVPLPARAALVPPTLAPAVAAALPDGIGAGTTVLAMRLSLAPLGVHLARHVGARRVVIDADDDDGSLLRSLGQDAEADASDRLARCWLPDADAVLAASAVDAEGIAARAGLDTVAVIPNSIAIPVTVPPPPSGERLLFVGNLTYEPNRVAARLLAEEVLPRVRARRPDATVDVVGAHGGVLDDLAQLPGVCITGAVPDVAPFYADAAVVVVPLHHGGGTRIKVLEAFAHQRPVAATSTAVSGLGVEDGQEARVADSMDDLARAVVELLDDPARAAAMVGGAARLVATRHSSAVVSPLVRAAVLG